MSTMSYLTARSKATYVRPPTHETWLKVAFDLSERGTCARRGVGCVILGEHGQVMSTGYNGVASKDTHCIDTPCSGAFAAAGSGLGECRAIHAEENALQQCNNVWLARTIYVTASPCVDRCLRKIKNTGIMTIVFAHGYPGTDSQAKSEWENSKPGRKWLQVHVPERCWAPLVMRPIGLDDGLYYTDDADMPIIQVSGNQVYRGNTVMEFSHPVMYQRIHAPTYDRRVIANRDLHLPKPVAQLSPEIVQARDRQVLESLKAKGLDEAQALADSRPRVFNASPDTPRHAKVLAPTGVDTKTGLRFAATPARAEQTHEENNNKFFKMPEQPLAPKVQLRHSDDPTIILPSDASITLWPKIQFESNSIIFLASVKGASVKIIGPTLLIWNGMDSDTKVSVLRGALLVAEQYTVKLDPSGEDEESAFSAQSNG